MFNIYPDIQVKLNEGRPGLDGNRSETKILQPRETRSSRKTHKNNNTQCRRVYDICFISMSFTEFNDLKTLKIRITVNDLLPRKCLNAQSSDKRGLNESQRSQPKRIEPRHDDLTQTVLSTNGRKQEHISSLKVKKLNQRKGTSKSRKAIEDEKSNGEPNDVKDRNKRKHPTSFERY